MKPIHEPKLTEFTGWQNDMEYLADEEECKRRTEWRIEQYRKQMREQYKPVFVPKWGAIFAALAVFSAVAYMLWQIWRAWPLLMGALK